MLVSYDSCTSLLFSRFSNVELYYLNGMHYCFAASQYGICIGKIIKVKARERGGWGGRETDRQTETETDRHKQRQSETETEKDRDRRRQDRQTERKKQRKRQETILNVIYTANYVLAKTVASSGIKVL